MKKILFLTLIWSLPALADYSDIFKYQQTIVNNEAYFNRDKKFLDGIDERLQKKRGKTSSTGTSENIAIGTTTAFDDGWVSTMQTYGVRIVRGNTTVLLHKSFPFTDELRSNIPFACWNQVASTRFKGLRFYPKPKSELNGNPYDFLQVEAVDNATGQNLFLSFLQGANNGQVSCTEAINLTQNDFLQSFPTMDALIAMSSYLPRKR
jgi:hypothetical protein